jgi:hypothetical protein
MKKLIYSITLGLVLISVLSCKKSDPPISPVYQDPSKADDSGARNGLQSSYDDIEKVYNSDEYATSANLRTTASNAILPCGSVTFNTNNFTINYSASGVNCGSRVLSGTIDVTLVSGAKFSDAGAKLKIVYTNYKVLYAHTQQSVTYNGTTYTTNVSGGTLISLFTNTPNAEVIHTVRGDLTLTFDTLGASGFDRSWKVFRKKTYQNTPGTVTGITLQVEGDTTLATDSYITGTYNNVTEMGMSMKNEKFVCNVPTPFRWENCGTSYAGPYTLKQGKVEFTSYFTSGIFYILGYTKATWSATAGYRYDGPGAYTLDGGCGSNGYKIDASIVNPTTSASLYNSSEFIFY